MPDAADHEDAGLAPEFRHAIRVSRHDRRSDVECERHSADGVVRLGLCHSRGQHEREGGEGKNPCVALHHDASNSMSDAGSRRPMGARNNSAHLISWTTGQGARLRDRDEEWVTKVWRWDLCSLPRLPKFEMRSLLTSNTREEALALQSWQFWQ